MSTPSNRQWTDEQISAFLDGELNAADTEALARDVEHDPSVSARVERLGAANRVFIAAASEIDTLPMSDGAKSLLAAPPTAKVLPFRAKGIRAFVTEHRAIAAALICAVAVWGVASGIQPQRDPLGDGLILASSPLHRALETGATSEAVADGGVTVTPRLTFASAEGGYCRQFDVASGAATTSAIACRDNGQWRTQVAVFGGAGNADYQTASGAKSPMLEAFIDKHISGAPLDATAESRVITNRWSR